MALAALREQAARVLIPPPRLRLSEWLEQEVRLPQGATAHPGALRLWPYQRAIADAITDPLIERVTVVKPVRVGYTTLLMGAIASFVANDPAQILLLLPTESDCRDAVVSDLEPLFDATPAVAGRLFAEPEKKEDGQRAPDRNTLLHRRFAGGSLKVIAAKAPRNLRRHTARILFVDEADAMEVGPEGSPILLAEKRTLGFTDRKIVIGSTPVDEDTSQVLIAYRQSDQRVFEVPCPRCGQFTELLWRHIEWEAGRPETASFRCPGCQALVPEREKPAMVAAARWRAQRPELAGHAGFRLNALVSSLANASWGTLAAEFLRAREDTDELRVFVNTILAEGWKDETVDVDDQALATRAEPFSLEAIPAEVLLVTAGTDVQDDRLETSIVGWSQTEPFVLAHLVLWGSPGDEAVWREHDDLLRTQWPHPHGGTLSIDAAMVDSGDGDWTDRVYAYCFPRLSRHVMAVKGLPGSRPACEASKSSIRASSGVAGRLFLAGVDSIKSTIYDRVARGQGLRFSQALQPVYYEQLMSERKVVRYTRGQPKMRFERKPGARAEALDALVYAWAARHTVQVPLEERARSLAAKPIAAVAAASPAAAGGRRFVNEWMGIR